jgi:pimeloyl-ACP methyl ester carboxylesterase
MRLMSTWAIQQSGTQIEPRAFCWSHGTGRVLRDLQDAWHLHDKASELAELVRQLKKEKPERPVYLMAVSAGTALVLAAAEQLPAGSVERIILLGSALSPHYNLAPALRATRTQIVSFYSEKDWFILGWGTSTFGTADRFYTGSAGLAGFRTPDDPEARLLHGRLIQVPWRPEMMLLGNFGAHFGNSAPLFMRYQVVPWLYPDP